jgi:hypothetical protein
MKYCMLLALSLLLSGMAASQELFKPLNILRAYEEGYRSESGEPGKRYFQNHAHYFINVEVNPYRKVLKAREVVIYYNNSDDSLSSLNINLYQNYLRKGNIRDRAIEMDELTNGIKIEKFKINGTSYEDQLMYIDLMQGTSKSIFLSQLILPGDSMVMEVKWRMSLPSSHVDRFGCYNESSYFIGYWYPQIAVYDDIDGWDNISHTGLYEFYGDFNDYDVEITVPGKYAVWATGTWGNADEILKKPYLKRYNETWNSESVVHILSQDDRKNNQPFQSGKENIWKFSAADVTDFSFAISDNYLWDAVSFRPDSLSGQRVLMNAVYPDSAFNFDKVADLGKDVIMRLSNDIIGVTYPYPQMTVFNGWGGMEYPMMVNEKAMFDFRSTVYLTAHEICHSYMPFMTGINEKKYAWMDEGLVTYLPKPIEQLYHSKDLSIEVLTNIFSNGFEELASAPIITPSNQLDNDTYYYNTYYRPAVSFYLLNEYLGDSLFYGSLRYFINAWTSKHPVPYDLFNCFNHYTGMNLNWFWKKYFFSDEWPDLGLSAEKTGKDTLRIAIEKKGGLPVPVKLTVYYNDDTTKDYYYPMDIWLKKEKIRLDINNAGKNIRFIQLGGEQVPDVNASDNILTEDDLYESSLDITDFERMK